MSARTILMIVTWAGVGGWLLVRSIRHLIANAKEEDHT